MTGGPFGRAGGETPPDLGELVGSIFEPPDHRGLIGEPDVVVGLDSALPSAISQGCGLGERGEIVRVIGVVRVVAAHRKVPR